MILSLLISRQRRGNDPVSGRGGFTRRVHHNRPPLKQHSTLVGILRMGVSAGESPQARGNMFATLAAAIYSAEMRENRNISWRLLENRKSGSSSSTEANRKLGGMTQSDPCVTLSLSTDSTETVDEVGRSSIHSVVGSCTFWTNDIPRD